MSEIQTYNFSNLIYSLPERHKTILEWGLKNKNKIFPWSEIHSKKLAIIPKGIYKPEGWKYAISVKTVIQGPYDDGDVFVKPSSGEWRSDYRPESNLSAYTNKALIECQKDFIPVLYFKQTAKKPNTSYRLIGPCLVYYSKDFNYFNLYGFSDEGELNNFQYSNN